MSCVGAFMIRLWGTILLLLGAFQVHQVQAAWACDFKLQDDIIINPQYVKLIGVSGDLHIEPDGKINRNGQRLNTTPRVQQQAAKFQTDLRRDIPWLEQEVKKHLEKARHVLDDIVAQKMGSTPILYDSLATLDAQLTQQVSGILEKTDEGYIFHHQEAAQLEQNVQKLIGQAMGKILKDSINEAVAGLSKAPSNEPSSSHSLQDLFVNLGQLQQSIQDGWRSQDDVFGTFGQEACLRLMVLDNQRQALVNALPVVEVD